MAFASCRICWALLLSALLGTTTMCFNEELAVKYAKVAGAAYCGHETRKLIEAWNCGPKCIPEFTHVTMCQGLTTISVVGLWGDDCAVAFEGSQTESSFAIDAFFLPRSIPYNCSGLFGCLAHEGFYLEWKSHETCVKANLDRLGCNASLRKGIRTTGHSLGAGVNLLAMLALDHDGYNITESYHFGTPRVGNHEFAQHFNSKFGDKHWRVTHSKDPVPHLPPAILGWEHVEPEVFYKGNNSEGRHVCANPDDTTECAGQHHLFDCILHARDHLRYMDVNLDNGVANGCKFGITASGSAVIV